MLGLTDNQLATVMDAARRLPIEKRSVYLQRIAAMLAARGGTAGAVRACANRRRGVKDNTTDAPAATVKAGRAKAGKNYTQNLRMTLRLSENR